MKQHHFPLILIALLSACVSIGSKTIHNDLTVPVEINKVLLSSPKLLEMEFYAASAREEYFKIIPKEFIKRNVKTESMGYASISFDAVDSESTNKITPSQKGDYLLLSKIIRKTVGTRTSNYIIHHKLIDCVTGKMVHYSKYSVSKGTIFLGQPTDEIMIKNALRKGLHRINKDFIPR